MNNSQRSALQMSGFSMRERGIADRVKQTTVSAIKEMVMLGQAYTDAISLAQGTPSFLTPGHIRERIKKELDDNPKIGKYCTPFTGLPELKQAVARTLQKKRGITADAEQEIYITIGAMEAVATAVMAVVNPGEEVLLLSPCFPSHIVQVSLAQGIPVFVPLIEDQNFAFDINAVRASITNKTKAIIICNPANPTGTVFFEKDIRALAGLAMEHDFWIITDEPYDFLVYDGLPFFSASQLPEIKDRLIACFTFSKEYAMSGFRIGYVYGEAGVINQMLKIHDSFVVTTPTISQYAALEALQGAQTDVEYFKQEFVKRRELICRRLDQLGELFSYQKPQGAYYIFPHIACAVDDYEFALRLLADTHVITVPGSAFGPTGKGHLRLCYAMGEQEINEAFDRLERWWEETKSEFRNPKF